MAKTLADIPRGQNVRIVGMLPGSSAIRQRLLDMGVTKGAELRIERVAPLGDPIEVHVKGYHLAIRKNEAATIAVETM